MVVIDRPPPKQPPVPIHHVVPAGTRIVRVFDPSNHGATALTFRHYGPLRRFDHQRSLGGKPYNDPERGIYYGAFDLPACLVEVFGDTRIIVY